MRELHGARSLVFALNGQRIELPSVDLSMTLSTYLRTQTALTGTKIGCGEGGCGACVVLVSKFDADSKKIEELTVNACLALLCSLDGCAITTIEGIRGPGDQLHAVQKRFAGFHATQCGFCTPGMCMSVYGFLRQQACSKVQALDAAKALTGNICRCTGYRPIIDACCSFASDIDVEDLGLNTFWRPHERGNRKLLPTYNAHDDPPFPEFLRADSLPLQLGNHEGDTFWIQARTLQDVASSLQAGVSRGADVELVAGNTSRGIYKEFRTRQSFIDISRVPDLQVLQYNEQGLEIGAAVTFSKLISYLDRLGTSKERVVYQPIAEHLRKVASPHVRNRATIGGNLVMARKLSFDSDLATILLGVGASVKVVSGGREMVLTAEEFLEAEMVPGSVVLSVVIPSFSDHSPDSLKFSSYRASPRASGNAVALVNSAFLVHCLKDPAGNGTIIQRARLAFGAFGGKHAVRAVQLEDFLTGKTVTAQTILDAIGLLKELIIPRAGTRKASYRQATAVGFFYKFFSEFMALDSRKFCGFTMENGHDAAYPRSNLFISSRQELQLADKLRPVGEPSSKVHSEIQASGEAVYVDDIPSPPNCLHAAFVYSEKALAKVRKIKLETGLSSEGAVAFVGEHDIPLQGQNIGLITAGSRETLFASGSVHYIGQPLGVLLADSDLHARAAAAKVEVDYDCEALGTPTITIEDAVARDSYFEMWPFVKGRLPKNKGGDVSSGFAKATHKIEAAEVRTGFQYFFYMETQTTLAVPDEDNCIVIYSACQSPEYMQATIACCLGIPMHNVRVITRRLGGGFGGKAFRACIVATACALAAFKLKRPVRMSLDRNTDMIMMGGRHATKAVYSVGFTPEGVVTALKLDVFLQAGWGEDLSPALPLAMSSTLMKYNWGALEMNFKVCRTNIPARTAMRAPGDTQGSFISDAVIEHVAAVLDLDTYQVIEKNMHTSQSADIFFGTEVVAESDFHVLPRIWEKLKDKTNFKHRLQLVEEFNSSSRWLKRGLSIIPCIYKVLHFPREARVSILSDSSIVVEVGGIEMGQGLWTKVTQATAHALSQLWDGEEFVDTSSIRVVQADSLSLTSGGITSGSTTSEGSCEAVLRACRILVERLMPIKARQSNAVTWKALISQARNIDLSAQSSFRDGTPYLTFGAALSEVKIDVLTGETTILETQLIYDCGKSMNPAVDIGQIEGAFVQGIGYFMTEEYVIDEQGKLLTDGTWTYKPPTIDNVPKVLNIELMNSSVNEKRILSSKASGEPPLLLASSVHCAIRNAVKAARKELNEDRVFRMDAPATIDVVRTLCGVDNVERYLKASIR